MCSSSIISAARVILGVCICDGSLLVPDTTLNVEAIARGLVVDGGILDLVASITCPACEGVADSPPCPRVRSLDGVGGGQSPRPDSPPLDLDVWRALQYRLPDTPPPGQDVSMQDVGIPDDAAPPADRTTEEGAAACEATRPSRLSERLPEFYPDITNCDQLSSDDESASEDARMEYLLCQPADKVCNSMWYGARDMPVAADAGASMITVGQYATMQKLAFLQSRQTIDGHNKTAAAALALLSDTVTLDPSNPVAQPFLRGENSVHNEYSRVPS